MFDRVVKKFEKFLNISSLPAFPVQERTFVFGGGQRRLSKKAVKLPLFLNGRIIGVWTRVIPGHTDLLIGSKAIRENDIIIREKDDTVQFGPGGKWLKIVRNDKDHLAFPLAPLLDKRSLLKFFETQSHEAPKELEANVCNEKLNAIDSYTVNMRDKVRRDLKEKNGVKKARKLKKKQCLAEKFKALNSNLECFKKDVYNFNENAKKRWKILQM